MDLGKLTKCGLKFYENPSAQTSNLTKKTLLQFMQAATTLIIYHNWVG